ncbi:NADH-ubiquinone reductase complex 1 MLRQ subunit-domain-containing protein [Gorgonomyces haynaldii]|nr:NADH-ubiquinone reductase complex 1 MLRQ subunit-domain-containing protein [Gorgonomyces haynaldii]
MGKAGLYNVPVGVYPLFAIMGVAVGGVGYYLSYLATRPDVVWKKSTNPQPWQSVQQHQNIKFYNPSGRLTEKWTRTAL